MWNAGSGATSQRARAERGVPALVALLLCGPGPALAPARPRACGPKHRLNCAPPQTQWTPSRSVAYPGSHAAQAPHVDNPREGLGRAGVAATATPAPTDTPDSTESGTSSARSTSRPTTPSWRSSCESAARRWSPRSPSVGQLSASAGSTKRSACFASVSLPPLMREPWSPRLLGEITAVSGAPEWVMIQSMTAG